MKKSPVSNAFSKWMKHATLAELKKFVDEANALAATLRDETPMKKFNLAFKGGEAELNTRQEAEKAVLQDFLDHGMTSTLERAIERHSGTFETALYANWSVKLKP